MGLQFEGKVTAGNLITAACLAASVILAYGNLETRITVNETKLDAQAQMNADEKGLLIRLEQKLDRLIERGSK